jgi:hypothetical protein
MADGFGFRGGEQTPLTFIEMRQHRRLALRERIFVKAESMTKCGAHFVMLSVMREMGQIADTLEKLISAGFKPE